MDKCFAAAIYVILTIACAVVVIGAAATPAVLAFTRDLRWIMAYPAVALLFVGWAAAKGGGDGA